MTSDSGKAVSYFRDVFPELAAMPDDVLTARIEKLRRIDAAAHYLDWLDASDAVTFQCLGRRRVHVGDSRPR